MYELEEDWCSMLANSCSRFCPPRGTDRLDSVVQSLNSQEGPTEQDWMLGPSALVKPPEPCAQILYIQWAQTHPHHVRGSSCLGLSACHLRVLGLQVAIKLGLGGEELTTQLTGEGAF